MLVFLLILTVGGASSHLCFVIISLQAVTSSTDLPALKFPAFLPPDVEFLREPVARDMAAKIQLVPVQVT